MGWYLPPHSFTVFPHFVCMSRLIRQKCFLLFLLSSRGLTRAPHYSLNTFFKFDSIIYLYFMHMLMCVPECKYVHHVCIKYSVCAKEGRRG